MYCGHDCHHKIMIVQWPDHDCIVISTIAIYWYLNYLCVLSLSAWRMMLTCEVFCTRIDRRFFNKVSLLLDPCSTSLLNSWWDLNWEKYFKNTYSQIFTIFTKEIRGDVSIRMQENDLLVPPPWEPFLCVLWTSQSLVSASVKTLHRRCWPWSFCRHSCSRKPR